MRIYLSPPEVSEADIEAVVAAMRSGWIAPAGPALARFEEGLSVLCGRRYAVALSSGTAALHLALKSAGVCPGDLVLLPTMSFAAPAFAVRYCGAEPFWIDVDPENWQLDPSLLASAVDELQRQGRRIGAVVGVDLYGQCGDWAAVSRICAEAEIPFIEDAAEALGAGTCLEDGSIRPAGSWGQAGIFSFNGNKILTTSGGGMWVGDDEQLAAKVRKWASQSREPVVHYEHHELGYNYRMSNLLAALGCSQLESLRDRIERRKSIFKRYGAAFDGVDGFSLMPVPASSRPNYWLSCFTVDPKQSGVSANEVQMALHGAGIESRPLWKPLHRQTVFVGTGNRLTGVADQLFADGLCLPSGAGLTLSEQEEIIDRIRALL
ncbi:MAG: aminotransferase class I/II-fold pyridoxal phosphate-dependent enzyme [Opitutales bacterium]|nr:aminotransferase class I/II-fold pyridoxal phosphate-dependent enzyme [Opitutales bacterium]